MVFHPAASLAASKLNPWNNRWSEIHDFSSHGGTSVNWAFLDPATEFTSGIFPLSSLDGDLVEELSLVDEYAGWSSSDDAAPPTIPFSAGLNRTTQAASEVGAPHTILSPSPDSVRA